MLKALKFDSIDYKKKILILVISLAFFLLITFSIFMYLNVNDILKRNEYKSNEKSLSLIKNNIENMNKTIEVLANSIYYSADVQYLMDNNDINSVDAIMKINKLNQVVAATNFLKDIYIYNNNKGVFYSTQSGIFQKDEKLQNLYKQYENIPSRKILVIRESLDSTYNLSNYKFYFLLNQGTDDLRKLNNTVIFNISTEWLINSLRAANEANYSKDDNIFLITEKNEFLVANSYTSYFQKKLTTKIAENSSVKNPERFNYFEEKIQGENYLITHMRMDTTGWEVLRIQPYDEVFKYIDNVRVIILLTTIIALAIAWVSSITVSKKIYKPVGELVINVLGGDTSTREGKRVKDDIALLNDAFKLSSDKLTSYEKDKSSNKEILKTYYLRNFLTNSVNMSKEDMNELLNISINVCLDEKIVLCIAKIDKYKDFCKNYKSKDIELLKYAVANILEEIITPTNNVQTINMEHDKIVLLINADIKEDDSKEGLLKQLKKGQESILNYLGFTISLTISETITDAKLTSKHYNLTLDNSYYRFIYGVQCIITEDKIKSNILNLTFQYPFEYEKELLKQIRAGNMGKITVYLRKIFDETEKMNYNNIVLAMTYLLNSIKGVVAEINQARLDPINIDFSEYNQYLYEMESKESLYEKYLDLISKIEVSKNEDNSLAQRYNYLIDAIKDIIRSNYFDRNICINYVGDNLKMSPRYVGKIFKDSMGMSVAEYINDIRMSKSAELLVSTNISVVEIMGKVGIEYESQFYKLFKAKYGTTPKEYALKKKINM